MAHNIAEDLLSSPHQEDSFHLMSASSRPPSSVLRRSYYSWDVQGDIFDLDRKYEVTDYLGRGAYGVVCAAVDRTTAESFAIKKCKHIFDSPTLTMRTIREIRYLRFLKHSNIINIKSIEIPFSLSWFNDLYVLYVKVMCIERMDTDLANIVQSRQQLTESHVKCFSFQILLALEYLHKNRIVHRDLKPMNILVNSNCLVKLADFGLSKLCMENFNSQTLHMTDYVTTRWYRAPEVLVGSVSYSYPVDLWAAGTILAELVYRKPLFPGKDAANQLELITSYCGTPPNSFIELCQKPHMKIFLSSLSKTAPIVTMPDHLSQHNRGNRHVKTNGSEFQNVLKELLQMNPCRRPTATDALRLPFFHDAKRFVPLNVDNINDDKSCNELADLSNALDKCHMTEISTGESIELTDNDQSIDSVERLRADILAEVSYYHSDLPDILHLEPEDSPLKAFIIRSPAYGKYFGSLRRSDNGDNDEVTLASNSSWADPQSPATCRRLSSDSLSLVDMKFGAESTGAAHSVESVTSNDDTLPCIIPQQQRSSQRKFARGEIPPILCRSQSMIPQQPTTTIARTRSSSLSSSQLQSQLVIDTPADVCSPLQLEHFRDMSRVLSNHYSAKKSYRGWQGATGGFLKTSRSAISGSSIEETFTDKFKQYWSSESEKEETKDQIFWRERTDAMSGEHSAWKTHILGANCARPKEQKVKQKERIGCRIV